MREASAAARFVAATALPLCLLVTVVVVVTAPVASPFFIVANALVVLLLERLLPFHAAWKPTRVDVAQTLFYAAVSAALTGGLQLALAPDAAETPLPQRAVAVCGFVVVSDFCAWVAHRALHRVPLLWRLHAIHHALPRLWSLNAVHNHPFDVVVSAGAAVVPLVVVGAAVDVVAAVSAVCASFFWWQHANARLRLGAWNRVLAGPELHRVHHSTSRGEADGNYGMVFSFWDVLFGTWRAPVVPAAIGVDDGVGRATLAQQLRAPFTAGRR